MLFEIEKNKSVATDFSDGGAFQKCVIFSNDESLIVTGGADGYLRVWKVYILIYVRNNFEYQYANKLYSRSQVFKHVTKDMINNYKI